MTKSHCKTNIINQYINVWKCIVFERVANISYLNSHARGNRNVMFTFQQCARVKEWEESLIQLLCNFNQRLRPLILYCIDSLCTVELDRLERYLVDCCDATNTLFTLIKNNSFHLCVVQVILLVQVQFTLFS